MSEREIKDFLVKIFTKNHVTIDTEVVDKIYL